MSDETAPAETTEGAEASTAEKVEIELDGSDFAALVKMAAQVYEDGPKGLAGNKQAARRARKALNEIKKACTPLRIKIQEAVKPSKSE